MRALLMTKKQQGGWKPGPNTIAYYPLDSTNTVNDLSGNGYHLTNLDNQILFGNYNGVNCALFNKTNTRNVLNRQSGQIIPTTTFTWLAWLYINSGWSYNPRIFTEWNTSRFQILLNQSGNLVVWSSNSSNGVQTTTNSWHLYAISGNFSTGQFVGYKDTTQYSFSGSSMTPSTGVFMGAGGPTNSNTSPSDKFDGCMSKIIIENRIWTYQEISDYLNQTKSLYGIS